MRDFNERHRDAPGWQLERCWGIRESDLFDASVVPAFE
jgi:hypothetical protein